MNKKRFDIKKEPLNSNIDIHILSISSTIHTHPHTWKKAPGEYGACGSVHGFHLDDGVSNWCVIISDEKSTGEYYHHHHNDSNGGGGGSRSFLMCGFFPHSFCSLVLLLLALSRARRLALYELMIQIRFVKLSAPDLFRLNFAPFPLIFESNCQIGNISFLFCSHKKFDGKKVSCCWNWWFHLIKSRSIFHCLQFPMRGFYRCRKVLDYIASGNVSWLCFFLSLALPFSTLIVVTVV